MMSVFATGFRSLLAAACLVLAAGSASAAQVSGISYDDTARVGGQELQLNGLGVRTKVFFKVYAAGLYLPRRSAQVNEILAMEGARRIRLVMMRELTSEDFGQAFMDGLNKNSTPEEKTKLLNQTMQLGQLFGMVAKLGNGDTLMLDWVPGTGTVVTMNGRRLGEPIPDVAFYNAILKIWIGNNPADSSLKPALLGSARR